MGKETTKKAATSPSEEYVVERLRKVEKDLEDLVKQNQVTLNAYNTLIRKYKDLLKDLHSALDNEGTRVEVDDGLKSVYVQGNYIGLCAAEISPCSNSREIMVKALADLIELVKRTPQREE